MADHRRRLDGTGRAVLTEPTDYRYCIERSVTGG
jgi:hypothetical protein